MNKLVKISLLLLILTGLTLNEQVNPKKDENVIDKRVRVIIDNDFGGDPDGLFQLAHHLLSPSVEIRGIIGSKHYENGFYGYPGNVEYSYELAKELLDLMDLGKKYSVYHGADIELPDLITPIKSEGAVAIINEAMRNDTNLPLYIVCGAGLTNIASAYLMEPKIAEKIILVWIGGEEYKDLAYPPPGKIRTEYNTGIDIKACQVIFNTSTIPIWQVPRNAYRQALISYSELLVRVKLKNNIGNYLVGKLDDLIKRADRKLGEAYVLGDNPLVLITAFQSS